MGSCQHERASGQTPLVEMGDAQGVRASSEVTETDICLYAGKAMGCVSRQPDIVCRQRRESPAVVTLGGQRLRDELRFEGAVRGFCVCGSGMFVMCHRGAGVGEPQPCALHLRLCSATRPFYLVTHFARQPTAGTATAEVESTHGFGYASCGPIAKAGGLLGSVLTSVHELSHGTN